MAKVTPNPGGKPMSKIEKHPERDEIEKALARGDTLGSIQRKYKVDRSALEKHASSGKMDQKIVTHADVEAIISTTEILETVKRLMARFELQQVEAQKRGDVVTSVRAGAEAGKQAERMVKLLVMLQEDTRRQEQHHFSRGRIAAACAAGLESLLENGVIIPGSDMEKVNEVFSTAAKRFIRESGDAEWSDNV